MGRNYSEVMMEKYVALFLPGLLTLMLVRLAFTPVRAAWRLLRHSLAGLASLSLINAATPFTGLVLPINAVTVLAAGFGGVPGLAVLILLETL